MNQQLLDAYNKLIAGDRRYVLGGLAGGGKTNATRRQVMGEASGRKSENRRLRQQLGEQAGAAVAELHELVAQTRLQHRALAGEQLALIDRVTTLQASRSADLARLRALEEGLQGAHLGLGELQDLVERVQLGLPNTIGATLLEKVVELKSRLLLGADAVTVETSIYERLRWIVLGIVPRRAPILDVARVNSDPADNRVIRRDPDGRLQAVP